jgi:uncharacterized protein YegP (UPF0339 family)
MKPYKLTTYQDKAGGHRWRMQAPNGKIVADSGEAYASKRSAERAAAKLIGAPLMLITGKDPVKIAAKGVA